jgi:opacity protein-like surface antigen
MKKLLLGAAFSALASAAFAADVPAPVYKAPPASVVVSANGWYFSVDAAGERVNLPDYALGFREVTPGGASDSGPFQTFSQRFDGYHIGGSVGYFLPHSNTLFGSDLRIEIGGLYRQASGAQTGSMTFTGGGLVNQTLNGVGANVGYLCSLGQVCTVTSNQSTNYSDWRLHGKIAGDHRMGKVVVTPSLAVFGGEARDDHTLAQIAALSVTPRIATYNANTSLHWADVGARVGLDLKVDVTPRLALGVGGWAGFADRRASLSGSDVAVDNIIAGFLSGASTISTTANATPLLANAEAGLAFKWIPALTVRGFVGLNYDSKTPGVSSPSFSGSIGPLPKMPAGIAFRSETSYYAGGGVSWAFGQTTH